MLKIALDFDSVLADTMVSWVREYNARNGAFFTKEHVKQWEFWHDFNMSWEQAKSIFEHVWENWETLPETEKNLEKHVVRLRSLGSVDIVTTVSLSHIEHVKKWLKLREITYDQFVQTTKKEELPYDIFIDDYHKLALSVSKENKTCFLYD